MMVQVVDPPEPLAHTDGPGQGRAFNLKFVLDIIQDIEGSHSFTVKLVHKCYYRGIPHPANFHQFLGLRLDPFCAVNYHQCAVNGSKDPVGIL